jgi:DNA-binding transcriptional ArsR family regulator
MPPTETTPEVDYKDAAAVFALLSDPTRLLLLQLMASAGAEGIHVGAMCEAIDTSQPAASHHLALLRHSGLVTVRRQGKHNFYSIADSDRLNAASVLLDSLLNAYAVVV